MTATNVNLFAWLSWLDTYDLQCVALHGYRYITCNSGLELQVLSAGKLRSAAVLLAYSGRPCSNAVDGALQDMSSSYSIAANAHPVTSHAAMQECLLDRDALQNAPRLRFDTGVASCFCAHNV